MAARRAELFFLGREALSGFLREAASNQAFMVLMPEQPELFSSWDVVARLESGHPIRLKGTVVQAFPSLSVFEVVFQLEQIDLEALRTALVQPMGASRPSAPEPQAPVDELQGAQVEVPEDPASPEALPTEVQEELPEPRLEVAAEDSRQVAQEDAPELVPEGEVLGTAPIFRIKAMDVRDKVRLAPKADRDERIVLAHDTVPLVLTALLSNPRVDVENVLTIVKSVYAPPDLLQRIATDRRWLLNTEIRVALVHNPKTPTPISQRLMETLPMTELRSLAKEGGAKEDLRRVALALVTKGSTRN